MSDAEEPLDIPWRFSGKWALGLTIGVFVLVLLIVAIPQLNFWFSIYWGYQGLKEVFYQDLHLSDAWSTFLARVLAFFYGFAWTPIIYLAWRRSYQKIAIAFGCYVFLFGLTPAVKALFGTDICFNQLSGASEKWYVKAPDGTITLYDSPGYDSAGVAKQPVTTVVCHEYEAQKKGATVHQLSGDFRSIPFFRADTGAPLVWYDLGPDGKIRLFDGPGFDPETGEELKGATPEIRDQVLRDLQREKDAEEAEQRRAAEQAQQAQEKADADQRATQQRAEEEQRREARTAAEQEQREAALNCVSGTSCSLALADDGTTVPVFVPFGRTTCFDQTFWTNLDRLGYETAYHNNDFADYPCSGDQARSGQCGVQYMDRFRFRPQAGVPLPRYWFVDAGAKRC